MNSVKNFQERFNVFFSYKSFVVNSLSDVLASLHK